MNARSRRRALPALLVLLLGLAGALTACGGSESATDVVARAFGKGDPIKSATVDVSLDLSGEAAGGQPLKLGLKGPYKTEGKGASFDFAVDLGSALAAAGGGSGAAGQGQLGLLNVGGKTYVKLGGQPFLVGEDVVQDLQDDERKGEGLSFSSLGISPRSWLTDPKTVGDEQLAGEDVTHVRAGVDRDRLATDLVKLIDRAGKASGADQAKQAADTVKQLRGDLQKATIDVWAADGDGALRRMKLDATLKSGRIVLDFGLSKINEDVKIEAPRNAPKLQDALQLLQGSSGSASGSGTGSSGSSGSASGSSSGGSSSGGSASGGSSSGGAAAGSSYEACVQRAGRDIDALQRCASLAP